MVAILNSVILQGVMIGGGTGGGTVTTPTAWDPAWATSGLVVSNSNRTLTSPNNGGYTQCLTASQNLTTGKYYVEHTVGAGSGYVVSDLAVGFRTVTGLVIPLTAWYVSGIHYRANGSIYRGGTILMTGGANAPAGTVIGLAIDLDARALWVSVNGVWQYSGNPSTGANPVVTNEASLTTPLAGSFGTDNSSGSVIITSNFGSASFVYPIPTGFTGGLPAT